MLPTSRGAGRRIGSASLRAFNNGANGPREPGPPAPKTQAVADKLAKDGDAARAAFEALLAQGHAKKAAKAAAETEAPPGLSLGQAAAVSVLLGVGSMLGAATVHANRDPTFRAQANSVLASLPTQPKVPQIPGLFVEDPKQSSDTAAKSPDSKASKDKPAEAPASTAVVDQKAAEKEAAAVAKKEKEAAAAAAAAAKAAKVAAEAEAKAAADARATAELVAAAAEDAKEAALKKEAAAKEEATSKAAAEAQNSSTAKDAAEDVQQGAATMAVESSSKEGAAGGEVKQPARVQPARGPEEALAALHADLKRLDEAADRARFDNIEAVLRDVELRDATLRREVDDMLSSQTAGLGKASTEGGKAVAEAADPAALKAAVRRLSAELETRAKWEALRLSHLLQMVEDKAAAAHAKLIEDQQAVGERALASELCILAAEQATAERLALEQLQRRAKERRSNALAFKAKELRAAQEAEANAALEAAMSEAAAKLLSELDALAASAAADEAARGARLAAVEGQVNELSAAEARLVAWEQDSEGITALSSGVAAQKAGEGSGAAAKSKDPLVQAATRTLASAGGGNSSNANAIRARFEGPVRHACLQALYVPPGSGGSALGQLTGSARATVASWLPDWFPRLGVVLGMATVLPTTFAPPPIMNSKGDSSDNKNVPSIPTTSEWTEVAQAAALVEAKAEQQLQRVSGALANRDLAAALREAKSIDAPPRVANALQDWCQDASMALAANQASDLLLVHASVLNSRLS